jgi:hypothetical protein
LVKEWLIIAVPAWAGCRSLDCPGVRLGVRGSGWEYRAFYAIFCLRDVQCHRVDRADHGPAEVGTGFAFPTSAGSFVLNSVSGNSTFTALSTLTQTGGTLTNPVTFTQSGVGQIMSTIGGLGSEASYEFAWSGGAFAATASVAGANPTGSYLFQLSEPGNPGTVIADETLDGADGFMATINDALLASGDYVIALLANSPNDPTFTIDFATPVNGTAVPGTAVPEPPTLALLAPGLLLMFFLGIRWHKFSLNLPA